MKTVKLKAKGLGERPFGLAHAQSILVHQTKVKCTINWELADDRYEFKDGELNGVKRNKRTSGEKTTPVGDSASKTSAK